MGIVIAGLMYLGIIFAPAGNDLTKIADNDSDTRIVLDDNMDD